MKRVLGLISFLLAIQLLSGCDTGTTSMEKSDEVIDWGIQKSQELEQSDSSGRKYSYKII